MSAIELAAVVAAVLSLAAVAVLAVAVVSLARTLRELRELVADIQTEALPALAEATAAVVDARHEVDRVDSLLDAAESISSRSTAPPGSPTWRCPTRSSRPPRWPPAPAGRRAAAELGGLTGCSSGRSGSPSGCDRARLVVVGAAAGARGGRPAAEPGAARGDRRGSPEGRRRPRAAASEGRAAMAAREAELRAQVETTAGRRAVAGRP